MIASLIGVEFNFMVAMQGAQLRCCSFYSLVCWRPSQRNDNSGYRTRAALLLFVQTFHHSTPHQVVNAGQLGN